ncbi:transposase [Siccirubricoccus deserti]|uniref:Transposase n=1 Tax=Siccirubricoccus deserti TaxID=2013562 RepID=A0A9X0UFM0_9PROT|nr:transposase [Siccirubricoccus deserti]
MAELEQNATVLDDNRHAAHGVARRLISRHDSLAKRISAFLAQSVHVISRRPQANQQCLCHGQREKQRHWSIRCMHGDPHTLGAKDHIIRNPSDIVVFHHGLRRCRSRRLAQFDALRLRLVKLAAKVVELKTRVMPHLPSARPVQAVLRLVLERFPKRVI